MSYHLHVKKRKDNGILKTVGVFIFLCALYFLMGGLIIESLYSVQHGVAIFFGYYEDPIRPISENSLIKELKRENASLKSVLGRSSEPDVHFLESVSSASTTGTTSTGLLQGKTAFRDVGSSTDKEIVSKKTKIKDAQKQNTPDRNLVLAVILARPPRTPYDSLLVDIGEDEGLMVGDVVYAEQDYAVGAVEAVFKATSIIKLYSSPDQRIDVLLGSSTAPVVAEGRGAGNFYIKVPKNIVVSEGDQIVIPGIKSKILGTAERIDSDEGEAYAHVYFRMPVNLYTLHYVQIKKNVR
jgi:rod shape-determining protein MreC